MSKQSGDLAVDHVLARDHRGEQLQHPVLQPRKLNLKANFETGPAYLSFKCIDPGAFNVGLIGSACTALPCSARCAITVAFTPRQGRTGTI